MNRRRFLALTSATAAALPLVGGRAATAPTAGRLASHRIAALETRSVPLPWPRPVGRNAKRDIHGRGPTVTVAIVRTDQGAGGWGEMAGGTKNLDMLRAQVLGRSVAEVFDAARGILRPELHPLARADARLLQTKTQASPHAWGSGLKTVYAAHLVGGLGNAPTIEGVTCSHEHVDFGENVLRQGKLQLSTQPGFGLALRKV